MSNKENQVVVRVPIRLIDGKPTEAKMVLRSCSMDSQLVEMRLHEHPILTINVFDMIEALESIRK
jgi:hypothetical protein